MTDNKSGTGVIYVAFGYEYLVMALNSFKSLKTQHNNLPVTLVTNIPIKNNPSNEIKNMLNITKEDDIFDKIHLIDDKNENNRLYKTNVFEFSPYKNTLFLDVDTEIKSSIRQGFKFLDYFDVAFVFAPYPITTMKNNWEGDVHLEEIELKNACRWNSGVFFFDDSESTKEFFDHWNNAYKLFGYNADQFSLVHSAYKSPIRIMSLDLSWNANKTTMQFNESIVSHLKIHHYSNQLWELRSFENDIGREILDIDNKSKKNDLRNNFQKKYSLSSEIKSKLKRFFSSSLLTKQIF